MKTRITFFSLFLVYFIGNTNAQNLRTQYPGMIANSFFEINLGYIHYPFDETHLLPGYEVENILIPRITPRIIPFGHNFNDFLSAQIIYMRPVLWVRYQNVSNPATGYSDESNHPVFMNIGGFTLRAKMPLVQKLSVFGEAGLSVVMRSGFQEYMNPEQDIIPNAGYASVMLAGGFKYNLNKNWDLQLTASYTPGSETENQPPTSFIGAGFSFTMRELPQEKVEENAKTPYFFPLNSIHFAYSTNALGYGINKFVSEGKIPIFWGGYARVEKGFTLNYQRNVFHGKKIFSLDWGTNISYWKSEIDKQEFVTLSLYPLLRFSVLHTNVFDMYLTYSLAGPTYISGKNIDGKKTGPAFTFQDMMGLGAYIGKNKSINTEIRIGHYSNGNLFPENEGVMIPLTFNLGYTF